MDFLLHSTHGMESNDPIKSFNLYDIWAKKMSYVRINSYDGYFDPETYGNYYAQPISKSFAFGLSASF